MKKIRIAAAAVAVVLALGLTTAFAAGGRYYTDADGDGICDHRGVCYLDADGDGICDHRGAGLGHWAGHGCRGCRW